MDLSRTLFLLFECHGLGNVSSSSVVDIYDDWDKAEQARVGLEIYKEDPWLFYEVIEWTIK